MTTRDNLPVPGTTVVVVEDDSAVRNSLKFSLEIEGFVVRTYGGASDLLDSPNVANCACLVVDQNMPGMTGLDLIAELRERRISAPAILITSHPNAVVIDRAKRANITIIEKPLLNQALLDGVREACAQSARPHY